MHLSTVHLITVALFLFQGKVSWEHHRSKKLLSTLQCLEGMMLRLRQQFLPGTFLQSCRQCPQVLTIAHREITSFLKTKDNKMLIESSSCVTAF